MSRFCKPGVEVVVGGGPPPELLHDLTEEQAAAGVGAVFLGGLAVAAETGNYGGVLAAVILAVMIQWASARDDA